MDNNYKAISKEDYLNQNNSWFSQFIEFLKEKIFNVMHITLTYDSISFFSLCILCFVELMQLMTFPFNSLVKILINQFSDVWFVNNYLGIYDYFIQFFQVFKFIRYLKDKSFSLYLAIFYIINFLLFLICALFIYISISLTVST